MNLWYGLGALILIALGWVGFQTWNFYDGVCELQFELPNGDKFFFKGYDDSVDKIDDIYKVKILPEIAMKWVETLPIDDIESGKQKVVASWKTRSGVRRQMFSDFSSEDIIKLEVRTIKTHFEDVVSTLRREASESGKQPAKERLVNEDTDQIHNRMYDLYQNVKDFDKKNPEEFMANARRDFQTLASFLECWSTDTQLPKDAALRVTATLRDSRKEKPIFKPADSLWELVQAVEQSIVDLCEHEDYKLVEAGTLKASLVSKDGKVVSPARGSQTQASPTGEARDQVPPARGAQTQASPNCEAKKDETKKGTNLTILWIVLAVVGAIITGVLIWMFACRKSEPEGENYGEHPRLV